MGKGTAEPIRNRVRTEEAKEFLKVIRNSEYSVIQQLNKSLALISILALLISSKVHRNALLKVLKETCVPTSATESAFKEEFSVNAIKSTGDLTATIRPYVPGETVGHWTAKPYFVVTLAE
ncbi:hypothetical protein SO802_004967 [Lithocarpus litseifolius]|uniref:Uncharacterized protein n=1 Tax=Lithocarpus litseifolius TaxID=425828 RepID=A0AAW2DIB2_9ROSI